MTRGGKFLTLFLLELALLGGAAAGGVYAYRRWDGTPGRLKDCQGRLEGAEGARGKLLVRALLTEAGVGALRGNFGLAFERLSRARPLAQQAGLKLEPAFDEVTGLILQQSPKAREQLFSLVDKVGLPEGEAVKAAGLGAALSGPTTPAAEPGKAQAAPKVEAQAPRAAKVEWALEEAYHALLEAKTALLAGGADAALLLPRLARARVLLEEAGRPQQVEELDGLLTSARRKEEAQLKSGIDASLLKLRNP